MFKGDGELMVDMLVTACAQASQSKPPLPGFGRELVPYFVPGTDAAEEKVNTKLATRKSKSKRRPQQLAPAVPMICEVSKKDAAAHARTGPVNVDAASIGGKSPSKQGGTRFPKRERRNSPLNLADMNIPHDAVPAETQRRVQEAFHNAAKARKSKPSEVSCIVSPKPQEPDLSDVSPPPTPPKVARWAGGAFTQSPTPQSIPMPSRLGFTPSQQPLDSQTLPSTEIMNLLGVSPPSCGVETTTKLLTPQDLLRPNSALSLNPKATSERFESLASRSLPTIKEPAHSCSTDLGDAAQRLLQMLNVHPVGA